MYKIAAYVLATLGVGETLEIRGIQLLGTVLTVVLVLVWMFVGSMMVRGYFRRDFLWNEMDEDREEGGFIGKRG
jgi:hypothetical protein